MSRDDKDHDQTTQQREAVAQAEERGETSETSKVKIF